MKSYIRTESFRILNNLKKNKKKYTCEDCHQTFEADPKWMLDEYIMCDDCYDQHMEESKEDELYNAINKALQEQKTLKKIVTPNGREYYKNETNRSETK